MARSGTGSARTTGRDPLLTPNLLAQLVADGVDSAHRGREKPSDHAPVWAELRSG